MTYTPKHASWLNMVEQWFGVLTRLLMRRGDFASRDDLEAKITACTIRHNEHAALTNGAMTPTPSTPTTSNATSSPNPYPSSRKPHDRNAR